MAFADEPIVDRNSKSEDESVRFVKEIFNLTKGFITRPQNPDYGVDLEIELISNESGATSRSFAVQIKSSANFEYISDGHFISFSMKTSRLGYLYNRIPGLGIIVLFDTNSRTGYFDYIEDIINRIQTERVDDSWKSQANVNIHIPTANVLNHTSARNIYTKINNRYINIDTASFRSQLGFKVPIIKRSDEENIDFNDPIQIAAALEKFGIQLLNSFDFALLHDMLAKIPFPHIVSSKDLLFLAALTNSTVGMSIEADFFISKCFARISDFSQEQQTVLEQIQIQSDFKLGRFDYATLLSRLEDLNKRETNETNSFIIRLSILRTKTTLLVKGELEISQDFENELLGFIAEIGDSNLEDRIKYLIQLMHTENIGGYATKLYANYFTTHKVRESIGVEIPVAVRAELAKHAIRINESAYEIFEAANKFAKSTEDDLLEAYSLSSHADYFVRQQTNFAVLEEFKSGAYIIEQKDVYESAILNAAFASNKLLELRRLRDAWVALSSASELMKLFKHLTGTEITVVDTIHLQKNISALEKQLDITSTKSIVDDMYEKVSGLVDGWTELEPDQEFDLAKKMCDELGLPHDRIENVLLDIKAINLFEKVCSNPNLELQQDLKHTLSLDTYYAEKPSFIIVDKSTGFRSLPNTDIKQLMEVHQTLLKEQQ